MGQRGVGSQQYQLIARATYLPKGYLVAAATYLRCATVRQASVAASLRLSTSWISSAYRRREYVWQVGVMDANITGMDDQSDRLQKVICRIRDFRDQRDWMQFHNPKNLAASIVIEAAELLEHFQWKTPDESEAHAESKRDSVADEIADVAVYLIELADNLGIDLWQAIERKMVQNEQKYPVHKARGTAKKYHELQ